MIDDRARIAFLLATSHHQHQKYGDYPYMVHLYDVVQVLIEYGYHDPHLVAAAWLHDTLEDTTLNYATIKVALDEHIAEIVFAVTDELGRNRKERKVKTLPKLNDFLDAQIVKLADWIANLRDVHRNKPNLLQMYRKDYPAFKGAFRHQADKNMEKMWEEIERLLE